MAQKEVNGDIKCENSQFGDPVKGYKKACYCKHQNPAVLDEEVQFSFQVDVKGRDSKSYSAEKNAVSLDLHNKASKFTVLKHDKMVLHSNCWVNFSFNEKAGEKGAITTEMSIKQSPASGFQMDGDACWPGLDIKIPLTLNNNKAGEAKDDVYLYNMDRIEKLFRTKMFKESFLGTWSMTDEDS